MHEEALILKVPTSFSELRAVRHTLGLYQEQCPAHVALLLIATYLFMQVVTLSPDCDCDKHLIFGVLGHDFFHCISTA